MNALAPGVALDLNGRRENVRRPCEVCGAYTSGYAQAALQQFDLCDAHRTRAAVALRYEPPLTAVRGGAG